MKLQELYKNQLINNLKVFNVVLGLSTIGNPSIKEFLELSKKSYNKICRNKDNKRKAISTIMELSSDIMVLAEDCSFYNIQLLDLSIYDRIDYLLDKMLKYSSSDRLKEFFNEDFLLTIGYLEIMENHLGENLKQTLSYIVIRNFLVLCNLKLYRFAYYYAMFIKGQIFLSEGLNPRVEYSDLYKSELSLAIKKERGKFSKNIKKKIAKNVKDTVNLVPLVNVEEKRDSKFIGDSTIMPVSGSNMSMQGVEDLNNKNVKEYRDSIYDISLNDRKEDLKKNVNEASGKVINQGKEVLKTAGKGVYEGSKEFVKENLEVPSSVVEKVNKVKSKVTDGLGITNSDVDKSLEELDSKPISVDSINPSDTFSHSDENVVNNEPSAKKPKKSSRLENLRKKRKEQELARQQELIKQQENVKHQSQAGEKIVSDEQPVYVNSQFNHHQPTGVNDSDVFIKQGSPSSASHNSPTASTTSNVEPEKVNSKTVEEQSIPKQSANPSTSTKRSYGGFSPVGIRRKGVSSNLKKPSTEEVGVENKVNEVKKVSGEQLVVDNELPSNQSPNNPSPSPHSSSAQSPSPKSGVKVKARIRKTGMGAPSSSSPSSHAPSSSSPSSQSPIVKAPSVKAEDNLVNSNTVNSNVNPTVNSNVSSSDSSIPSLNIFS